ncbi:hypothetical protein RYH73_11000 [Olivibacter sp. CPCC 100613]|uniref:hypothetical protein n=1 Tax=Olivibacter sp. CPCC 100613 TaxID=3079931 RepID=UPI002FFC635E
MNLNENLYRINRSISIRSQLLLISAYVLLSYLANLLRHGNRDFLKSMLVSACVIAFFYLLAYIVRLLFNPNRRVRGLILGGIIFILFPLLTYLIVYLLLPSFNYYLYKPHVAFSWSQFFGNTLFAGFSIFLALGLYTAFYSRQLKQQRVNDLEQAEARRLRETEQMKREQTLSLLQSHHIKGSLHAIVCRAEELNDALIPLLITNLSGILDYSIDLMRGTLAKVSVRRELATVNKMIESAQVSYGDSALQLTTQGNDTGQFIAPLALVTLVENAFTHGEISNEHPLRMDLVFKPNFFSFTITNKISSQLPNTQSWGKGTALVQQSLSMLANAEHALSRHEQQGLYTVCLTITYNP